MALFAMKGLYRMPRNAGLLDYAGPIISSTTTGIALVVLITIIQRPIYSRLILRLCLGLDDRSAVAVAGLPCERAALALDARARARARAGDWRHWPWAPGDG